MAANEEFNEIDTESIAHQSNTNEGHTNDPEVNSDAKFAMEMDESDNSVEMVEIQSDSGDNELIPENVVFNNKTTMAELTKSKSKATRLSRKKPIKKRMTTTTGTHVDWVSVATKGEKRKRTHTGGNQHRCDG